MIKLSLLFLINITQNVYSLEAWSKGNTIYLMDRYEGVLFSENCNKREENCEAFKQYKNNKNSLLTKDELIGGKNKGAVVCTKFLRGKILILRNTDDFENAFCQFEDGSIVTTSVF